MEWEKIGYDVGWDFASFQRPLPPRGDAEVERGFNGFHHGGRRHVRRGNRFERKWLQIRFSAYRRRKEFDPRVTPAYLHALLPNDFRCPVTRERLTFGELAPTDWSIERVDNEKGYLPGNLIVISVKANEAKGNYSTREIIALANGECHDPDLTVTEWSRLSELIEPMVSRDGGKVEGVTVMHGQRVTPGMPMSGIAFFQQLIGSYAMLTKQRRFVGVASHLFGEMEASMCKSDKAKHRAFTRLVRTAVKRAYVVQREDQIWATPRVQRLLVEFADLIGGSAEGEEFFSLLDRFSNRLTMQHKDDGRAASALTMAALRDLPENPVNAEAGNHRERSR